MVRRFSRRDACGMAAGLLLGYTMTAGYRLASIDQVRCIGIQVSEARGTQHRDGEPPDLVGHLAVEGTPIDTPVVQARTGDSGDFYLTHDAWRQPDPLGCPYLERSCQPDGRHILVYGHHIIGEDTGFSPIYRAYEQDVFDTIGDISWNIKGGEERFTPLFARLVDEGFSEIRRFGFTGNGDLRDWLLELCKDAEAQSEGVKERAREASRALTLITCSSDKAGEDLRTILTAVNAR